ncbi:MAG: KH domain-containing protein, partial [Bdellovibrionaceae bacterium]|nr:KH domain-containing protein [Pseudobdellovibrionaceae bacterium]
MELKQVIENLIKRLVSESDQVEVRENQGERTLVFEVRVSKADMGRVIGKKGKTIEALRTIISAFGVKIKK